MQQKSEKYRIIAEEWLDAVTAVLWHDEVDAWLDYDIINGKNVITFIQRIFHLYELGVIRTREPKWRK